MLKTIDDDKFYSPDDLAKKFQISLASVYKLVRSGEIPSLRLGKIYRIAGSDLNDYLTKKRQAKDIQRQPVPTVARKFVDLLRQSPIGNRVREVYLYGSYARGDFDVESDIDLCLIVDAVDYSVEQAVAEIEEAAMAAMDYQELLSVRIESQVHWQRMQMARYPLAQNILREGARLWNQR